MVAIKSKHKSTFSSFLNKHWWVVFGLILFIALAVRLFGITKASIWHDEGFSAMLAARDWVNIWLGSARDVHPPLYYELLHCWTLIFGTSELALRSLSATAGVIIVALGMVITKKINSKTVGLLAGLILALNPFLVRYSQETRMYGVLGVFLLLALVGVIYIVENPIRWRGYILYSLGITAGLYTHYFTVLVVFAIWLYVVGLVRLKNKNKLILNYRWWLANIVALSLFLPWVPNMIAQLTRGQGLSWLPKTGLQTFNDTIWQFFTFTDAHKLTQIVYWLIPPLVIAAAVYVWLTDYTKYKFNRLIVLFSFVPMLIAIVVSIYRPIFHERYFAFAVIGICIIASIAIAKLSKKSLWLGITVTSLLIVTQLIGLRNVNSQSSHNMQAVIDELNHKFLPGDKIIAGELYVFFDGSFYNNTGQKILLYTGGGRPNGYGESGLIYNQDIYTDSFSQLLSGRVWVIGKTGEQSYYKQIPDNWELLAAYEAGYSEVRLYQIK